MVFSDKINNIVSSEKYSIFDKNLDIRPDIKFSLYCAQSFSNCYSLTKTAMRRRWLVIYLVISLGITHCVLLRQEPVHPKAKEHNDVAVKYLEKGLCVPAEERFRLALEYGSHFTHPHNGLGMIALLCEHDLKLAAGHFKDALAINSDFAEAHNNLGSTFIQRNPPHYKDACERFEAAIQINPAYLDARENLGFCLMRWGVFEGEQKNIQKQDDLFSKAKSQLNRLLELAPDNPNARRYLMLMDRVQQLRKVSDS